MSKYLDAVIIGKKAEEEYQHDTVDECRICGNEGLTLTPINIYPVVVKTTQQYGPIFRKIMKEIEHFYYLLKNILLTPIW